LRKFHNLGITYLWTDGFELVVTADNNAVFIKANKEGLISMVNHLLKLTRRREKMEV